MMDGHLKHELICWRDVVGDFARRWVVDGRPRQPTNSALLRARVWYV